jgi:hypothetical protein
MQYLIGTDEAGYGPNLGPLVIAGSLWRVPAGVGAADLYARLAPTVAAQASSQPAGKPALVIADSKRVYQSGGSLAGLERGVFAALGALGRGPRSWTAVWQALAPDHVAAMRGEPWCAGFDPPLPRDLDAAAAAQAEATLAAAQQSAGVALVELACRVVWPGEFNDLLDRCGSKGALLSKLTLQLAGRLLAVAEEGAAAVASPARSGAPLAPAEVVCDKHGGRNRYAGLLAEAFDAGLVETHKEGRDESAYTATFGGRRTVFRFCVRAESRLPVALASMAAKYLRELAMAAWNAYWRERVPGLQPTAGYPADAQRFRREIAAAQSQLGLSDRQLWRQR